MSTDHKRFDAAVARASEHIREMKRVSPYIFPEWNALERAKDDVRRANAALALAEEAWDRLGRAAAEISRAKGGSE